MDPSTNFDKLTPQYVTSLIPAIEGFEIEVTSVQAVFKLSQNRNKTDFESTVEQLRLRGGESLLVAEEMEMRREAFFAT